MSVLFLCEHSPANRKPKSDVCNRHRRPNEVIAQPLNPSLSAPDDSIHAPCQWAASWARPSTAILSAANRLLCYPSKLKRTDMGRWTFGGPEAWEISQRAPVTAATPLRRWQNLLALAANWASSIGREFTWISQSSLATDCQSWLIDGREMTAKSGANYAIQQN